MNINLRKEVEAIIIKSPISTDLMHAKKTLEWLLILNPKADEASRIAAFGHDVERGMGGPTDKDVKSAENYDKHKEEHSKRSANIIRKLMEKYGYSKNDIEKTERMILIHEIGGDIDSDVLRNADSIAYFDYNIPVYLERNGEEKTRFKIKYMYNRASENAKKYIFELKYNDPRISQLIKEEING